MKIAILCSDIQHPVFPLLREWSNRMSNAHEVTLETKAEDLCSGDILFLISCAELIPKPLRDRFQKTLVIHASRLPVGRGWSPLVWQVLEGRNEITVSLLEAEDAIDSGDIWRQVELVLEGHELQDEINARLFAAELELMDFAVAHFSDVKPHPQDAKEATYYRRRTPEDSRIDPEMTIAAQFDLLRIADPNRYPAYFEFRGHQYEIILRKVGKRGP